MNNLESPRWQLDSVFPGLHSEEFSSSKATLSKQTADFREHLRSSRPASSTEYQRWLQTSIEFQNTLTALSTELISYLYCMYSCDTSNREVLAQLSQVEAQLVPIKAAESLFRKKLAALCRRFPDSQGAGLCESSTHPSPATYSFFLKESLALARRQLSPAEEELAADLNRSGAEAWGRLQEVLTSTMSRSWDGPESASKTLVDLRSLAFHEDRETRERAFRLELECLEEMRTPLAAALNGVKGASVSLNSRRKYRSTLDRSLAQNRISRKTLSALLGAMRQGLPVLRRYLRTKAKLLGLRKLAFYDIFAPLAVEGASQQAISFPQAKERIIELFGQFSPELAGFAQRCFEQGWIDAQSRPGKVGGAYSIDFPLSGQSRILANYDGSFSSLSTLAHEIGHAYHSWQLRNQPVLNRDYPMTLAETASIFSETLVYNAAIEAAEPAQRTQLLESLLMENCQIIVDILSRYYFESDIMGIRKERELSPEELCTLMTQAQQKTYGAALDNEALHPYMWAVKGHYYNHDLAYYNFPYAFGQLFGLALFESYTQNPTDFPKRYEEMLAKTGSMDAVSLCKSAGYDIESREFWMGGIRTIERYVTRFEEALKRAKEA